jgi:hypothetical protein
MERKIFREKPAEGRISSKNGSVLETGQELVVSPAKPPHIGTSL